MHLWRSEFDCLRATAFYQLYKKDYKTIRNVIADQFCNVYSMDLVRIITLISEHVEERK